MVERILVLGFQIDSSVVETPLESFHFWKNDVFILFSFAKMDGDRNDRDAEPIELAWAFV